MSTQERIEERSIEYEFGGIWICRCFKDGSRCKLVKRVLTNNIANVDTPNYKRQDVEFTTYLKSALEQAGTPASTLTQKVNEANLSGITTRTYTENTTLSYRMDGNNVDLSTENAELAAEQINYNALIDSMNNEFTRMKAVLK